MLIFVKYYKLVMADIKKHSFCQIPVRKSYICIFPLKMWSLFSFFSTVDYEILFSSGKHTVPITLPLTIVILCTCNNALCTSFKLGEHWERLIAVSASVLSLCLLPFLIPLYPSRSSQPSLYQD